jgi:hypothetical protein
VLYALRNLEARMVSLRPLSAATVGPSYSVTINGDRWDLWFEASGIWSYYGRQSPYLEIVGSILTAPRPLGSDVLLIALDDRALVIECKYPRPGEGVSSLVRDGYHQAGAYAIEARSRLVRRVLSVAVLPEGIGTGREIDTVVGDLGVVDSTHIPDLVRRTIEKKSGND